MGEAEGEEVSAAVWSMGGGDEVRFWGKQSRVAGCGALLYRKNTGGVVLGRDTDCLGPPVREYIF